MQFTVPQFIEHESKLMGPFTVKQFVYLGVAGIICIFIFFIAPMTIFLLSVVFLGGIALSLAVIKIRGKNLPTVLSYLLKFNVSPKTYVWRNNDKPIESFVKDGIDVGEIEFQSPGKIKRVEETEIGKLIKRH